MFNKFSEQMFEAYSDARKKLLSAPESLIACEQLVHQSVIQTLTNNLEEFESDYNEASYLYPFWKNYPPQDRGRSPKGDQFPWIEVGEHSVGCKLARLMSFKFKVREVGLPSGPDQRFLVRSPQISRALKFTDAAMVLLDVKSVGPRDDFHNTVLSPYQVSGDGGWRKSTEGIKNAVVKATGARKQHPFHCALPPLYITSEMTAAPCISVFVKPVYEMLPSVSSREKSNGQPLVRITVATLPNGLLLTENPNYLRSYPKLFFPGKDEKGKSAERRRARISFEILSDIAKWRVEDVKISSRS